ncbi:MAG: type II toxin-antitoxin system Phd/YefM family antitoxin [Sphingomonadaceae bacterium]
MHTVTVHEAKTHLSRLINRVLAGEEIVVSRRNEVVIKLVPAKPASGRRRLGLLRGDSMGSDPLAYGFWDPVPDVDLALWNGEVEYPDDATAA